MVLHWCETLPLSPQKCFSMLQRMLNGDREKENRVEL